MKPIKMRINIEYHGKTYFENDIINVKSLKKEDLPMIGIFNEKGYIEPLTLKDLYELNEVVNKGGKYEV